MARSLTQISTLELNEHLKGLVNDSQLLGLQEKDNAEEMTKIKDAIRAIALELRSRELLSQLGFDVLADAGQERKVQ